MILDHAITVYHVILDVITQSCPGTRKALAPSLSGSARQMDEGATDVIHNTAHYGSNT